MRRLEPALWIVIAAIALSPIAALWWWQQRKPEGPSLDQIEAENTRLEEKAINLAWEQMLKPRLSTDDRVQYVERPGPLEAPPVGSGNKANLRFGSRFGARFGSNVFVRPPAFAVRRTRFP